MVYHCDRRQEDGDLAREIPVHNDYLKANGYD